GSRNQDHEESQLVAIRNGKKASRRGIENWSQFCSRSRLIPAPQSSYKTSAFAYRLGDEAYLHSEPDLDRVLDFQSVKGLSMTENGITRRTLLAKIATLGVAASPAKALATTHGTSPIFRDFNDPYLELIRLLREAAEIEHDLMVQYLYGA